MGHVGEVILVDQQEVAYEVEIENGGEVIWEGFYDQEQEEYLQEDGIPSTSGAQHMYEYDYMPGGEERYVDEDGTEYVYEEENIAYQEDLNPSVKPIEEEELVEYIEDEEIDVEEEIEGPSTSTSQPSMYVMKRGEKRKYPVKENEKEGPFLTFVPTYSNSLRGIKQIGKSKKTGAMNAESVDDMLENGQLLKRLQAEISRLKKDNETLKKEYEGIHRRLSGLNIVHCDAKQRYKEANDEKNRLVRTMAKLKINKRDLINRTFLG